MTPEEARKQVVDRATEDVFSAEQVIHAWSQEQGLGIRDAALAFQAAAAHIIVIAERFKG